MICKPCGRAADQLAFNRSDRTLVIVQKLHEHCEAPTTCPCHHVVTLPGQVIGRNNG